MRHLVHKLLNLLITKVTFENKPEIGKGIYTLRDVANILHLPYSKVNRWVNSYWDGQLGAAFQGQYSWVRDGSRAVSFHTVVEFYVMIQLAEKGVKTNQVLKAHKALSAIYNTPFPFAMREVLEELQTDGKRIFWTKGDNTITLDGTKQFNFGFVSQFFQHLEFGKENLVSKLWPMGKEGSVVVDPRRKFGYPVLENQNIYPEILYGHYKAGENISFIAHIFEITEKEVADAIKFCEAA